MTASSQARLVCTPGRLRLEGPLTTHSVGSIWAEALAALAAQPQTPLTLDASAVTQLDSAGLVLLHRLLHDPRPASAPVALSGLAAEYQPLLERIRTASLAPPASPPPLSPVERIGAATLSGLHTGRDSVVWTGASASALWRALCRPARLEGARVLDIMASAGTQALPIVLLIGFLMGTILAFQMGLVAQGFGAGLLVVNGIGIAMLRELGMTRIFGNPGSTELPLFRDYPEDFSYELGLQEAVVVGMADGYAQATRNASFVNLHSAAGVGHAMANIFTAFKNRTPMVITAGQQTRSLLQFDPFLHSNQAAELPKPYVKWSCEPARAEDVPQALARAYYIAMQEPRGPVFVSIPADDWDVPCEPITLRKVGFETRPDPRLLDSIGQALESARAPAFVVGAAVDRSQAFEAVQALAERHQARVYVAPMSGRCGWSFLATTLTSCARLIPSPARCWPMPPCRAMTPPT